MWKSKYGTEHKRELGDLNLELICYQRWHQYKRDGVISTEWTEHFRNVVNILWGADNRTKSVEWNPWMEMALEAAHWHPVTREPYPHFGLSGCASSGKTLYLALHGMVNWLSSPFDTLVMMTSTNLKDARKRVWAEVLKLWQSAESVMPGVLIDSKGLIVTVQGGKKLPDTSGISLVAGEKRKEKEAIGKIIGAKNRRVIMLADELPELTEAILEASFSNLTTNPMFQFGSAGNFKSRYDPFGVFVEPVDGYETLTLDSIAWNTKYGHCIRFDGMQSPNIVSGETWKGIYSPKHLKQHRQYYNEHQAGFWRMVRSFEAPIGSAQCMYSEVDFVAGQARKHPTWLGDRIKVSSLDPAFTNGGDRSVQWVGWLGQDADGKWVLDVQKNFILREDARIKDQTRNFQIARQFIENCRNEGVQFRHTGIDSTAAGSVFCDIVAELLVIQEKIPAGESDLFPLRVDFSGGASDRVISRGDNKTAKEKYDRRVSELWGVGTEFLKNGQLKGLTDELIREMKAREYDTIKGGEGGLKMRVQTKDDMRDRFGFSPDMADSFFVLIETCRQRLQFLVHGGMGSVSTDTSKEWERQVQESNDVYSQVDYSAPELDEEMDYV